MHRKSCGRVLQRSVASLLVVCGFAAFAAGPTSQAAKNKADTDALQQVKISENDIAKFKVAERNLIALKKSDPKVGEKMADTPDNASIDELAQSLDSLPVVKRAISTAGLTSRQYVLMTLAIIEAMLASEYVKQGKAVPSDVVTANVAIVNKHQTELGSLFEQLNADSK